MCYAGTHDNAPAGPVASGGRAGGDRLCRAVSGGSMSGRLQPGRAPGRHDLPRVPVRGPDAGLAGAWRRRRINTPGTGRDNWQWRLLPGELTVKLIGDIREMTRSMVVSPPSSPKLKRYTNRPRRLKPPGTVFELFGRKICFTDGFTVFSDAFRRLQHQLLRTALEGYLRQGVAAHRLYRHHSALCRKRCAPPGLPD